MSLLGRKKRNEVISLRLTEDRLEVLERYRKILAQQLHALFPSQRQHFSFSRNERRK